MLLYFEKKLEECKSNMKSTWKLLNEVLNNKKSKSYLQSTFNNDNREISDPIEIADHFCEYFTNIRPNLASSIPPSSRSYRSFLSGTYMNSIFLRPTTEQEILEICSSFRSGAASGYDQITMNVVKETVDVVIQPLTYILILSEQTAKNCCVLKYLKYLKS